MKLPSLPISPPLLGIVCRPSAYEKVREILLAEEGGPWRAQIPVVVDPLMESEVEVELHYQRSSWAARLEEIRNRGNTGREDDDQ